MRLIDADALEINMCDCACADCDNERNINTKCSEIRWTYLKILKEQPTIEPERKKGRWIKHEDRASWYCSECAIDNYYAYVHNSDTGIYELQDKFCPNCGARMTEDEG